jgi:hypothetical protein
MLTVAELLVELVSRVVVVTVSVSVMMVPAAVPAFTVKVNVNVAIEPGATLGFVQPVIAQVQPAGNGPYETKVVFAGTASSNTAAVHALGPELVTTCV